MPEQLIIISEDAGIRLDAFLAAETDYSRNRIRALLDGGNVQVNGAGVKPSYKVQAGDSILLMVPDAEESDVEPEDIPLDVIYDDADLCVVSKPQGMVVHPAPGHESGTLVNALLFRVGDLSSVGGVKRPGIVHRIDRMTSGLLVVAKNDAVHRALSEQFREHTAGREYLAIVEGNLKEDCGTVDASVGRHPRDRKKMAVVENGRKAVTHWRVLERFQTHTLLHVSLETGRTHQIRVHMAYIHHPVAGDEVYGHGKNRLGLEGQALHGYRLHFRHPVLDREMAFEIPLPDYFVLALKKLGWKGDRDSFLSEGIGIG